MSFRVIISHITVYIHYTYILSGLPNLLVGLIHFVSDEGGWRCYRCIYKIIVSEVPAVKPGGPL